MRFFALVIFITSFFGVLPTLAVAASTAPIVVRFQVGEDIAPPTTPTLLSAVPVSASQISLTWSPASDDFLLQGYIVSRDGVPIATTTLTSYTDTGLLASTTYSYGVRAFDWLLNTSTSSNMIATTTLNPPPAPPSPAVATSSASGASGRLTILGSVMVDSMSTEAVFHWVTNRPARYELRWGRTTSYELGMVASERARESHETMIGDLLPGTEYVYELVAFLPGSDIAQILESGSFITDVPLLRELVPNVQWLDGSVSDEGVFLSWQNPTQIAGEFMVRVVRSHYAFPQDPHDGMVVYQGDGESFIDSTAFVRYDQQFYTVFVTDGSGRWSSGAVVFMAKEDQAATSTDSGTASGTLPTLPDIELPLLERGAIEIIQAGERMSFSDDVIKIQSTESFTIRIAREALPSHLKSITVTLLDPRNYNRSFTFLLRLSLDQTAYKATLAPLGTVGITQMTVSVFDPQALIVGRYSKQVQFIEGVPVAGSIVFPDRFYEERWGYTIFFSMLGMSLGLYVLAKRRARREDNSPALP